MKALSSIYVLFRLFSFSKISLKFSLFSNSSSNSGIWIFSKSDILFRKRRNNKRVDWTCTKGNRAFEPSLISSSTLSFSVFCCNLGSRTSKSSLTSFYVTSISESLSEKSSETSVERVSSSPIFAKMDGGIRDPWPFHSIMYNKIPEGALDSYFLSFRVRVYFPFEAKWAMANFF